MRKIISYIRQSFLYIFDLFWAFFFVNKKIDIIFYCNEPSHYQNLESVYLDILGKNQLSTLLITKYKRSDYPSVNYPSESIIIDGFAPRRLSWMKTRILFTPGVRLSSSLIPKDCKVIHSMVSLTSLDGVYEEDAFNNYDYILCAGPHHFKSFKMWAQKNRKLRGKTLIPAGYPKLDRTIAKQRKYEIKNDKFTVLYAPTHVYEVNEDLVSLRKYGAKIIDVLIHAGYNVIFRPHPVSLNDIDRELVESIEKKHLANPAFILDRSKDYFESYAKADAMITDLSGTGFTFSLAFLKPTVFFSANPEAEEGLIGIQFSDREKIGGLVRNTADLIMKIDQLRSDDCSEGIAAYRAQSIFNVEKSTNYIVGVIDMILVGQHDNDWVVL